MTPATITAALAAFTIGGALGFIICAMLAMGGHDADERRAVLLASALRACLDHINAWVPAQRSSAEITRARNVLRDYEGGAL